MSIIKWFPLIIERALPGTRNATNYRLYIEVDPEAKPKGAILCQERFEWGYKWLHFFSTDRVEMELIGHAIEAHVAARYYSKTLAEYERDEAWALVNNYSQFGGWTHERAITGLMEKREAAAKWCKEHRGFVEWAVKQ